LADDALDELNSTRKCNDIPGETDGAGTEEGRFGLTNEMAVLLVASADE
jgi:hypothetical protein